MRPTPIPDSEVYVGERVTIAPPGGDFLDPEVSAVEALVERGTEDSQGRARVNRYNLRLVPESDDLARLNRGDPLWLSINCPQLPVFSVGFVVQSIPTGLCKNCRKTLLAEGSVQVPDWGPETIVFHAFPGQDPECSKPEMEWVEANPPTLTKLKDLEDLAQVAAEKADQVFVGGIEAGLKLGFQASTGDASHRVGWGLVEILVTAHRAGVNPQAALEEALEAFLAWGNE